MARIRTIKPEYWSSAQVMDCSRDTRLFFIGMWNFADDAGRLPFVERSLKAQIFPGDEDIDSQSIRRMIVELEANGLVAIYTVEGRDFIQITGWKHQRIDKPQLPKCPDPIIYDDSANDRRARPPDLTLSNPNGNYLRGDGRSLVVGGAASGLPSGKGSPARAATQMASQGSKPPHLATKNEIEASFASRKGK